MRDRTDTIRSWYGAFSRRDEAGVLEPIAPRFVADWSRSIGPIHGVYDGHEGLLEMCRSFWELWESSSMEPQDFIESGSEVIVPIRTYGRGRAGIEVEARSVHVWRFDRDRVQRVRLFADVEEALAAQASTK